MKRYIAEGYGVTYLENGFYVSDGYGVTYEEHPEGDIVFIEDLQPLINEYRPTMDKDVLHSWAQDVVAALKKG
ncbi:hypothetical protein PHIN3_365 [Sinorhizobium phage phiN3]|uniref:Uncharacterized protein n=1 Tax=Sinorhizobium phage phiN3 TaxID=1647405 RepID=A0A0F6SJ58_9CAUD|nr:hypothetical protein AVT40_gp168 [Sinorhizobium phage phiN3]AKF13628.1 hypothetical protein PHIN3_365 [Sinorhizobium phage phiN3]